VTVLLPDAVSTVMSTRSSCGAMALTEALNVTSACGNALSRSRPILAILCCSHCTTNGYGVSFLRIAWSNSATTLRVGRSQNWNVRATRPCPTTSSSMPRAAIISSVAGCNVDARGASLTASAASKSRTATPRWASASAVMMPTGPPPAIRMGRALTGGPLLLLDAGGCNGFRPDRNVPLEHRPIFGRRVAKRIGAVVDELLAEFRFLDRLCDLAGELVDDFLGRARGCHQAVPGQHFVFGIAGFRDGRHFRGKDRALLARHRQHPHVARLGLREGVRQVGEHRLHVAGDDVAQCRRITLVRNVDHVETGLLEEQHHRQMVQAADAGRAVRHLTFARAHIFDELLQRVDRQILVH